VTFRVIRPLSWEERFDRAQCAPVYIPRIYLAVRRSGTKKTRWQTWGFAKRWFHAWVWGCADLPWEVSR
jgi:hypothetical protein